MITQLSGKSLVRVTFILLIKDLIVALIAGFGVFLGIEAYNYIASNMKVLTIAEGLRIYALIVAGYSRWGWLTTLDQMTADAIVRFRKFLRGKDVPELPVVADTSDTQETSDQPGATQ